MRDRDKQLLAVALLLLLLLSNRPKEVVTVDLNFEGQA